MIFLVFSLRCWEGLISKHFTVSLHLLFTKHVTNSNCFDLFYCYLTTHSLDTHIRNRICINTHREREGEEWRKRTQLSHKTGRGVGTSVNSQRRSIYPHLFPIDTQCHDEIIYGATIIIKYYGSERDVIKHCSSCLKTDASQNLRSYISAATPFIKHPGP